MTEKEKMLSGQLYNANVDQELVAGRLQAKELCYEFNQLHPAEVEAQKALIKKLLGKTKGKFEILAPFWCDYGCNIEIGANFYANHNLVILDCAKVRFGDNVLIGPNCGFYTAGHPVDAKRRNAGLEYARPIKVGDNVWIGAGVHVMPGVSIGNNVVIGGGSVVVQDIPDNVVAVGNPCRVVRSVGGEEKRAEKEEETEVEK
jgi:maltose O-acetyltransferase